MFRSLLLVALIIVSNTLSQAQPVWTETTGPSLGVSTLATNSKNQVFAGTSSNSIFRSDDRGQTWMRVSEGLPNNGWDKEVRSICVTSNDEVYMLLFSVGVFRSTNDGATWTSLNSTLPTPTTILTMYAKHLPNGSTQIFAATNRKAYISDNSGETWTEVKLPGVQFQGVYEVFISPNSDKLIISIAYNKGIFRSKNRGVTWRRIDADSNGGPINTGSESDDNYLTIRANRQGHIFVGRKALEASTEFKNAVVMRSTNDGETYEYLKNGWDELEVDLRQSNEVTGITFGKGTDVYATTSKYGLYYSSNNGDSWALKVAGMPEPYTGASNALAATPNNHIFTAPSGFNNVFALIDPTMSVQELPTIIQPTTFASPNPASDVVTIAFELTSPGTVRADIVSIDGSAVVDSYSKEFPSGPQSVGFRTSALAQGVYSWRLTAQGVTRTGRFSVVR